MSPLWRNNKNKQLLTNSTKPSPSYSMNNQSFAQSVCFRPIKEISLFTSVSGHAEGSMTVEASVILPLLLCFFLNLGCALELIRLHGNLEFALCEIGNRMSVYGCELISDEDDGSELKDIAFSYVYVKNELVKYLGEQYLEEAPISQGASGLKFWESEIFTGEDCFEMIVTYEVAPFSGLAGFRPFRMANRYYGHLWNGYHIPGTDAGDENSDVVYVTPNGEVYHVDRNCSHLSLSVRAVSLQEAYTSRNEQGEHYVPCTRCKEDGMREKVYITKEGNSIHYRKDCPGLKRTVYAVAAENAGKYRACSRCAGE